MRTRLATLLLTLTALVLGACHSSSDPAPAAVPPPPPPPPPAPGSLGLDARPNNLSCVSPPRPAATVDIDLIREFAGLAFTQPLAMMQSPGDPGRWFVLEKTGRVRVFSSNPATTTFLPDFINVAGITNLDTDFEGGLLGMAFHPDYASNGQVFLSWTDVGTPMTSIIARFTVNAGGQTLNTASRVNVLALEQDFENHNGGNIAFGPDGRLYIGFGDGGSSDDPFDRGQETRNLLGDLLRLDVNGGAPYTIPADNPFAGNPVCPANPDLLLSNCPEIYAWGLRNPWRFSFDRATGDLWLGDVGQGAREEIDVIERGGNYGWDCREGNLAHTSASPSCSTATAFIGPVHDYLRSEGVSVTGGYVYRGDDIPELIGNYVFGDFGSGRLWRLVDNRAGGFTSELLLATGLSISSFGEAGDGELYVVDLNGGLYRIARGAGSGATTPIPDRLSATGCMLSGDPSRPGTGLIPYAVQAPFWSDGAVKERWLALPNGTAVTVEADGDFSFPPGSVLVKQFRLGGALIETRLLMRHPDGSWAGYTYEWDAALNDGLLVDGGKTERIGIQDWLYPSSGQCDVCHTAAAGRTLGLEIQQLNASMTYAATGRTANQLTTLSGIGVIANAIGDPAALPSLSDPYAAGGTLPARARSWLHTNCAQCHRPGGPTSSTMDLRFSTGLAQTNTCDRLPAFGNLGLGAGARVIAPGNASLSVLIARINRRDANGMPPLASHLVDSAGALLISNWIAGLGNCL
jgi:uncharacterized repeat protein (TIGR03806 family)